MAETRSQALLKGGAAKEMDGVIASRFDVIEKDIKEMNERREEESRQIMAALAHLTSQANQPSTSHTAGVGNTNGLIANHEEQNRPNLHLHHPNYIGMTEMTKIEFPRFDGNKFKEWLGKAEHFFVIDMTQEEKKVGIVSMHFTDEAATWHLALIQEDVDAIVLSSWRVYKSRLKERFEEVLDDPMAELKELKETSGIIEYNAKFELIRTHLRLPEEYLLSAYLAGVRLDTQMHIRKFSPQSTHQCFVLGRLYEKAHPQKEMRSSGGYNKIQSSYNPHKGILTMKKNDGLKQKETTGRMVPFLSQAEMNERRSKGLCYYCDEKNSFEHAQKHRKPQLYSLDGENEVLVEEMLEEQEEEESEIAQISVNAMTGITDYTTMKVKGSHEKKPSMC